MKRSDIKVAPVYYQTYLNQVPDEELLDILPKGGIELFIQHQDQLEKLGDQTYAPNKWTVNEMIEHLMDTERIFLNRALRFARNDKTDLPGYDENFYAASARSNEISIAELLSDYQDIRKVTFNFFKHLNQEELRRTGKANGQEISVLALGFIQIGHPIHHFKVLEDRYFPLLNL